MYDKQYEFAYVFRTVEWKYESKNPNYIEYYIRK